MNQTDIFQTGSPHISLSEETFSRFSPKNHSSERLRIISEITTATTIKHIAGYEIESVHQLAGGATHAVFHLKCRGAEDLVLRATTPEMAWCFHGYNFWQPQLSRLKIAVPSVIEVNTTCADFPYPFMLSEYIPGQDFSVVYNDLDIKELQGIAEQVVKIQHTVTGLQRHQGYGSVSSYSDPGYYPTWFEVITNLFDEYAKSSDSILSTNDVKALELFILKLYGYYNEIPTDAFLPDVTIKNVIIERGNPVAICDVDEMGFGDLLITFGQTKALLAKHGLNPIYFDKLIEIFCPDEVQLLAIEAYSALFCSKFMRSLTAPKTNQDDAARLESLNRLSAQFRRSTSEIK